MKTIDAVGEEITIGAEYGYSKSQNGMTWVVTGIATAAENGKVTLEKIIEKNFTSLYKGNQDPHKTIRPNRRRTIASVQVFRIVRDQDNGAVKYEKLKSDLKELLDMDVPNNFENASTKLYLELIK